MFDSHDTQEYKSIKAPDALKARIFADADALADKKAAAPKKVTILTNRVFMRSASAIAACFFLAVAMIFALRPGNADLYIQVDGERLNRAGESVAVRDAAAVYGRNIGTPAGIPIEITGKGDEPVAAAVTGGTLWVDDGSETPLASPCTVKPGDLLYWLPDGDTPSTLTLTCGEKTAVYTLKTGDNPAEIQIIFEK